MERILLIVSLSFFSFFNYVVFFKDEPLQRKITGIIAVSILSPAVDFLFSWLLTTGLYRLLSFSGYSFYGNEKSIVVTALLFCIFLLPLPVFNFFYSRLLRQPQGVCLFIYMSFMMVGIISRMISFHEPVHVCFYILFSLLWFLLFRNDITLIVEHTPKLDYRLFCSAGLILLAVTLSMEELTPYILRMHDRKIFMIFTAWLDCAGVLLFFLFLLLTKSNFDNIRQTITIRTDALKEAAISRNMLSSQENVIVSFAEILESKSGETGNHVKRVSEYCRILARNMGYSPQEVENIRVASMMHDIGKLMVPNEILEKKGKLTAAEESVMRQHVVYGGKLLQHTSGEIMDYARIIALQHHERWDGGGYPEQLSENRISPVSRIVSLADVFDALVSSRSYKRAWPPDEAKAEIVRQRGRQFAPDCVDSFLRTYDQFLSIIKTYPDREHSGLSIH
jgi:HD-GYP domain-containing protein (c-di-GMP phosphodiesterase class II)